ncbi:pullulanase-type alpha-1,6-glucosidase [Colwellia sp. RE-S-Sl-9]
MVKLITTVLCLLLILSCQKNNNIPATVNISLAEASTIPSDYSSHWISPNLILIPKINALFSYKLGVLNDEKIEYIPLSKIAVPESVIAKHPHLASFQGLSFVNKANINQAKIKQWLKAPLAVLAFDSKSKLVHKAYVQTGVLLDVLYTSSENDANEVTDLGATLSHTKTTFKIWAPTAKSVELLLFNDDKSPYKTEKINLIEDKISGIWFATVNEDLTEKFYQYTLNVFHPKTNKQEQITTTDPYSLSLSTNSEYSQVVNLNAANTKPTHWELQQDVVIGAPENNIFYETHIRDFSASDKAITNKAIRGKYIAFTLDDSFGIQHLKALNAAGINNIHLLPTFDIGTVNENSNEVISLDNSLAEACKKTSIMAICEIDADKSMSIGSYLTTLSPSSDKAQAIVSALREYDNYNWGYDPFHYTVPEGSYALNPDGVSRIIEFREMVQSIHNLGFRVIMDVVYNHTHKAGLAPTSVLDKIVPNYYQRLHPYTGEIEQSTCCDNTATERTMMAKLMTDSLVVWARDYKIDGFRFDLMAHQPKALMLAAREAVKTVDPDTYFYGEGWNFGEVANNQQFVQASQLELAGTEIGTFTDRLRDAVRGGAFNAVGEGHRKSQGIGNGLASIPNELQTNDLAQYYVMMDQLRIGLAGNLANYPLINRHGDTVIGKDIPYGDQPTGYALDPADTINYVSKHDNQALWDNNQYRIAYHVSTDDRVRMQLQSLSFTILAQGIPFLHMGSELLRSKSFLRDSYDYSDWFNRVDFSKATNFYNVGLPPKDKDEENWSMITQLLKQNDGKDHVSAKHIKFSANVFMDFIKLRMSTPLFRLTSAHDIIDRLTFHNTGKEQKIGLVVMQISDDDNPVQLDENINNLMVVFNTNSTEQFVPFEAANTYQLHPIQQSGADKAVKQSRSNTNGFYVPALTTAVFIN